MTSCKDIDSYLDGWMTDAQAASFEAHLTACASCREFASRWKAASARVAALADRDRTDAPSEQVTRRLVTRAEEETRRVAPRQETLGRRAWLALAASVVIVAAGTAFLARNGSETGRDSPTAAPPTTPSRALSWQVVSRTGTTSTSVDNPTGARLSAPDDGRILAALGRDRLGLAAGGALRVERALPDDVRLVLERGEIACEVSRLGERASFVVEAGRLTVRVRGTRFSVALADDGGVEASVNRGTVEVGLANVASETVSAGRMVSVSAAGDIRMAEMDDGSRQRIDSLLEEPRHEGEETVAAADIAASPAEGDGKPPAGQDRQGPQTAPRPTTAVKASSTDVPVWSPEATRKLLAEGRHAEAERELVARLSGVPDDATAWMLLADCRRNQGQWLPAVEAYRKTASYERDPWKASRARFLAGSILQDRLGRHAEAAALFESCLAGGASGAPRPETMLRLARALVETGERERARSLLADLTREHPSWSGVASARDLLWKLEGERTSGH